jgi:ATP adenylyltransferase
MNLLHITIFLQIINAFISITSYKTIVEYLKTKDQSMELLYAPWRSKYFTFGSTKRAEKNNLCPFCSKFNLDDRENLILKKFKHCVIMLNLHPYNAGHLLIMPLKHTAHLHELSGDERSELMEITSLTMQLLENIFQCDGINMGLNKGKASGGSIQDHLHIHVLPRFIGDTNFLGALANTKQISFNIYDIYDKLLPHFQSMNLDAILPKED